MKLICIAHRGEAQQFIQALKLKTRNNEFYHNHDLALLITGEGHLEVMTKLKSDGRKIENNCFPV